MFDKNKTTTYQYTSCYRCGIVFDQKEDKMEKMGYRLTGIYTSYGSANVPTPMRSAICLCSDCGTKLVNFLEDGIEFEGDTVKL